MFSQPNRCFSVLLLVSLLMLARTSGLAQERQSESRTYPKEIRGYKLERATVTPKRPDPKKGDPPSVDGIITFGEARVAKISPLGVTLEVPIVVAPVKQKGHVDFLAFDDMTVNDTSVEIADYYYSFDLPNDNSLTLSRPLTIFVAMPSALVGAVLEWASPRETWPVTGVVYVFGQFKKSLFKFKRVVPVELYLQMRNPLRDDQ